MAITQVKPSLSGQTAAWSGVGATETIAPESVLIVTTSGTTCNVTITTDKTCNLGKSGSAHDIVKALGATDCAVFGPFEADHASTDGVVHLAFSATTNVKAMLLARRM